MKFSASHVDVMIHLPLENLTATTVIVCLCVCHVFSIKVTVITWSYKW